MSRRVQAAAILAVAGLVAAARLVSQNQQRSAPANGVKPAPAAIAAPPPSPRQDPPGDLPELQSISLAGIVRPQTQAALSSPFPARISRVYVHTGQDVRQGELLVQLDESAARATIAASEAALSAAVAQKQRALAAAESRAAASRASVSSARAEIVQAQQKLAGSTLRSGSASQQSTAQISEAAAAVSKAQAAARDARRNLTSLEALSRVGGVSKSDLADARSQSAQADTDLRLARARLKQAESGPERSSSLTYSAALANQEVAAARLGLNSAKSALQNAVAEGKLEAKLGRAEIEAAGAAVLQARENLAAGRITLAATRLVSPIAGFVSDLSAREGETAQPGAALVTVMSRVGAYVEALATGRQIPYLRAGRPARIAVDTLPGRVLSATLSTVSRVAEPDGRTFRVRFRVNQGLELRPGQLARVTVQAGQ
ncbi:MAG TPA: efflux RND transporter periplasmic adaptor subunit [Chthonomonadales bacterium]|nr:efflux RND transporter periplasmic adaptor subunit [Chthonomonadales bacterium]